MGTKIKTGDRVRVLGDNRKPTFPEMVGEVVGIYLRGQFYVQFEDGQKHIFWESELELVKACRAAKSG